MKYRNIAFSSNSQVNFCVQSFSIPYYKNDDNPIYKLLAQIISYSKLHQQVREEGIIKRGSIWSFVNSKFEWNSIFIFL